MRYRPDLERLATLDAARIDLACTSPDAIRDLIDHALDEALEHEVSADDAYARGDADQADYFRQEASAWRATVTVLSLITREVGASRKPSRRSGAA